jgi:hypothetical protein
MASLRWPAAAPVIETILSRAEECRTSAPHSIVRFIARVPVAVFHLRNHQFRVTWYPKNPIERQLIDGLKAKEPSLWTIIRKTIAIYNPASNQYCLVGPLRCELVLRKFAYWNNETKEIRTWR